MTVPQQSRSPPFASKVFGYFPQAETIFNPAQGNLAGFFYIQDYVQDERYIAIENMDVRRNFVNFAGISETGGALRRRYCLPGLASQIPLALGLGFLPRTVLAGNPPTTASTST